MRATAERKDRALHQPPGQCGDKEREQCREQEEQRSGMQDLRRINGTQGSADCPGREDMIDVDTVADRTQCDERRALQQSSTSSVDAAIRQDDQPTEQDRIERLRKVGGSKSTDRCFALGIGISCCDTTQGAAPLRIHE